MKPRAKNPRRITLDELFLEPPLSIGPAEKAPHQNAAIFAFFRAVDTVLRKCFNDPPEKLRACAIQKAVEFVDERLNGKDGLGAIFPPIMGLIARQTGSVALGYLVPMVGFCGVGIYGFYQSAQRSLLSGPAY